MVYKLLRSPGDLVTPSQLKFCFIAIVGGLQATSAKPSSQPKPHIGISKSNILKGAQIQKSSVHAHSMDTEVKQLKPVVSAELSIPSTIQEVNKDSQSTQVQETEVPAKCSQDSSDPGSDWRNDMEPLRLLKQGVVINLTKSDNKSLSDKSDMIHGKDMPKKGLKKASGGNVTLMPSGEISYHITLSFI